MHRFRRGGCVKTMPWCLPIARRPTSTGPRVDPERSRKMATTNNTAPSRSPRTRIVILGGGFGGVYTARHLEKLCRRRPDVEIVLVSRDNFLLMTPLLFEVCSGVLDFRHCSFSIRAFLRTTRFGEGTVQGIDLERRVVRVTAP